jgi:hypothetical protein
MNKTLNTLLLFICSFASVCGQQFGYGLQFKSYEVEKEKRTRLNLRRNLLGQTGCRPTIFDTKPKFSEEARKTEISSFLCLLNLSESSGSLIPNPRYFKRI